MPQIAPRNWLVLVALATCLLLNPSRAVFAQIESSLVILTIKRDNGSSLCKGAVVSPHVIITAAHCLVGQEVSSIRIKTSNGLISAKSVEIHPFFRHNERKIPHYDIALVATVEKLLVQPLPIIISKVLNAGDNFSMFNLGKSKIDSDRVAEEVSVMEVADAEETVINYLNLKRGIPSTQFIAKKILEYLKRGDPIMREKVALEFKGVVFSLYAKNRASICLGDSGAPAIILSNGRQGIVGIATGVTKLEEEKNPRCDAGGTSIITTLNDEHTVKFLREFSAEIDLI